MWFSIPRRSARRRSVRLDNTFPERPCRRSSPLKWGSSIKKHFRKLPLPDYGVPSRNAGHPQNLSGSSCALGCALRSDGGGGALSGGRKRSGKIDSHENSFRGGGEGFGHE